MTYAESVTTSELGAFSWERTAANNSARGTVGLAGHKPTANVVNAWPNNCCGDECMKVKSNSSDATCVTMAYDARRNRTSVGCNEESSVKIRVMVLSVSNLVCDWGWNFVCLSPSQVGDLYNTGTKTCVMSWDCRSSTTLGNWHLTHSVAGQCNRRCSTLSCCPQKWQASFSSSVKCCFWRDCQVQCLFSVPWGTSLHCNDQCVKRRRDSRSDARPQCSSNGQRFPSSFGEVLHPLLVRGVPCPASGQCLQRRCVQDCRFQWWPRLRAEGVQCRCRVIEWLVPCSPAGFVGLQWKVHTELREAEAVFSHNLAAACSPLSAWTPRLAAALPMQPMPSPQQPPGRSS